MKILIADDSRVMRQIVARALRQAGYGHCDVVEAVDGEDALLKVHTEDPDLVLSDWSMPRMTGLDLLATLRRSGDRRAFGFVTSEATTPIRTMAAQAGAQFLIAKPFSVGALREALEPLLG